MTATLLPNGKQSFNTSAGIPLVGGKVFTYAAGTSTPQTTWADSAQVSANTNPIILDGRGEAVIFWNGTYKVVLQDALGNVIWTVDNVSTTPVGIDLTLRSDLASPTPGLGASLIAFFRNVTGAVARTLQSVLSERVSAADFGAVGDAVYVSGNTAIGTDNTAALQAAITYACSRAGTADAGFPVRHPVKISLPAGDYLITGPLVANREFQLIGEGQRVSRIIARSTTTAFWALSILPDNVGVAPVWGARVSGITFVCDGGSVQCDGFQADAGNYSIARCEFSNLQAINPATGFYFTGNVGVAFYQNVVSNLNVIGTVTAYGVKMNNCTYNRVSNIEVTGVQNSGWAYYIECSNSTFEMLTCDGCYYIDAPNTKFTGIFIESFTATAPVSGSTAANIARVGSMENVGFINLPSYITYGLSYTTSRANFIDVWFVGPVPTFPVLFGTASFGTFTGFSSATALSSKLESYTDATTMQQWSFIDCEALTDRREGIKVVTNGAKPAASAGLRGQLVLEKGLTSDDDRAFVCYLNAAGAYVWKPLTASSGVQAFTAATAAAVTLATPEPDASYQVSLTPSAANGGCWVTAKATTGFTINFNTAFTGNVDWTLAR